MLDTITKNLLSGSSPLYQWTNLEAVSSMVDGGGADTGGRNQLLHGKSVWKPGLQTSVSAKTIPATLTFTPVKRLPGQPWDNCYQYNTITRTPPFLSYVAWELDFSIGPDDLQGNAREFEVELCESGWTYNMAWQYKWSNVDGPPAWRLFDQVAQRWVAVAGLPTPRPFAGISTHVEAYFVIDRTVGQTTHDSITVDSQNYPIGLVHRRLQKWSPQTNYLHNAVQIDSLGDGRPGSVSLANWNVRGL